MKFISIIFMTLLAFFAPVGPVLIAVGCAILLDTLFGIYASFKTQGRKSIKSRILGNGLIAKMIIYELAIILLFVIDEKFLTDIINEYFKLETNFIPTKLGALALIFIEVVSLYEKLTKILGYDLIDKMRSVLGRAKSIKTDIKEFTEDNDKDSN